MITKLNLATHPFRNRTTPYLLALLLLAIGIGAAMVGISQWYGYHSQNELARKQVDEMEAEVKRLTGEGEKVQQQLTPAQRDILVASHKLVANKAFGWSRLFADLEGVLPGSVSASRIAVENIYRDGDRVRAELELGVISRDYQAVMGMLGTMNNSGLFQAELRSQDLQQNEHGSFTEYTLHLVYTPSAGQSVPTREEIAKDNNGGGAQ